MIQPPEESTSEPTIVNEGFCAPRYYFILKDSLTEVLGAIRGAIFDPADFQLHAEVACPDEWVYLFDLDGTLHKIYLDAGKKTLLTPPHPGQPTH